jgi:dCMP deaminase
MRKHINNKGFDEFKLPCKDLYIMNRCFGVSTKSLDPDTKHGCISVDEEGGTLTTGYNGPPMGCLDNSIPLTRPEKYDWLIHSEANCIFTAARNGISLKGSHFYITGMPCFDCLLAMIQVGVSRITYGPLNSVMLMEDEYFDKYKLLFSICERKVILREFIYIEGLIEMNPRVEKIIENCPPLNFNMN